jgi:hypothetical protein
MRFICEGCSGLCARMRQPPRSDGRLSMATSLAQLSSAGGLEGSSFVDPFGNDGGLHLHIHTHGNYPYCRIIVTPP